MNGLSLSATEDVVNLGAETILAHVERVSVSTGRVVSFQDCYTPSGRYKQGGHGEPCHA